MKNSIIIRKAKAGDENGIGEMVKEGLARKIFIYTGRNKYDPKKIKKMRKQILSQKGEINIVAVDKEKNKVVGHVHGTYKTSGRIRHRIDFGWQVHPDYQGRGIGTRLLESVLKEAKKRGLKKALAETVVLNKPSIRIAKKCGFKIEGKIKNGLLMDNGKFVDTYILGRLL